MIPPGSTIGIVGGGQLGRMLSMAAAQLGYRCHIFDPHEHPCAADVAAEFTRADFDDEAALTRFAASVDVATYEFENLPVAPLKLLGDKLRPSVRSLAIAQDRAEEKKVFMVGRNLKPRMEECLKFPVATPMLPTTERAPSPGPLSCSVHSWT